MLSLHDHLFINMLTEYSKPKSVQYVELLSSIQDHKQSYIEFLMMNQFLTQEVTTKDFITKYKETFSINHTLHQDLITTII